MKLFHGAHLQITRAQPDAQVADLRIGSTLSFADYKDTFKIKAAQKIKYLIATLTTDKNTLCVFSSDNSGQCPPDMQNCHNDNDSDDHKDNDDDIGEHTKLS